MALGKIKSPLTVLVVVNSDTTIWAFQYDIDTQKSILVQRLVCRENSDWGVAKTNGYSFQRVKLADEKIFKNCPKWGRVFWCPSL